MQNISISLEFRVFRAFYQTTLNGEKGMHSYHKVPNGDYGHKRQQKQNFRCISCSGIFTLKSVDSARSSERKHSFVCEIAKSLLFLRV